jgi:hypothetical protein
VTPHLPLPRHCDDGKQDGDKGFLIHNSFYYHFCLAKVRKTAQKALGKAQKLGAEGVGLNSG